MIGGQAVTVVRGELKDSFVQSHPCLRGLDKVLGWTIMLGLLGGEFMGVVCAISGFVSKPYALSLYTIAACFSEFNITLLTFMLWHTFCYYDPRMRKIMTTKTRVTPDGFMRIGILPIPAAASVGILMWVTAVLVSPSIVGGAFLQPSTAGGLLAWMPTMTCRAASVERADYLTAWDARIERSAPSSEKTWLMSFFGATSSDKTYEGSCFNAPYQFTQSDVMDSTGKDLPGITNLANPEGDTEGRLCMYQCVQWQSINLQTLLTSSGVITVGAGIVVVFTEYFSGKLGLPTITENTSPQELENLITRISPESWSRRLMKPFQASMVACAFPILAVWAFLKFFLVAKIDADGFGTVDYYVVYCLLYSVSIVTLMRMWHFFEARPQLYTKNLWHQGVEDFIITHKRLEEWIRLYGKGEFVHIKEVGEYLCVVNVDLYQWMHLRAAERTELLVNYCQRPGQGGTEIGSKLKVVAPCKVTLTHEVDLGGGQGTCHCEKIMVLRPEQELTVVGWKDALTVKVSVFIAGQMETVKIDKHECLEKHPDWDKEIFDTLPDSIDDPGSCETGESGSPVAKRTQVGVQPSVSGLKQKLLTIEQKLTALEQAS